MQRQSDDERAAYAREQTEEVLRAEASAIHGDKGETLSRKGGGELYQGLNRLDAAALCLSGGGIRSAAFSLGVVQALATHPRSAPLKEGDRGPPCAEAEKSLLSKLHYLSTVSGGGYVGSWLSAWRSRSPFWDAERPAESIWKSLISRPLSADDEPPTLAWLRSYSNYLTPRRGILSADSWSAFALVARNLILNWLVILPIFCAVIFFLKVLAILSDWVSRIDEPWRAKFLRALAISEDSAVANFISVQSIFAVLGIACLISSLAFITRNRPTRRRVADAGPAEWKFIALGLVPAFLSAVFLAQSFASDVAGCIFLLDCTKKALIPKFPLWQMAAGGAVLGMVLYAISWIVARIQKDWSDFRWFSLAGAVYGALLAPALYAYIQIPEQGAVKMGGEPLFWSGVLHLTLGIPWILISQALADMIFVGLTSYQANSDADREWLGRASAWLIISAVGWFLLTFLVFVGAILGPHIISKDALDSLKGWATGIAAVLGVMTALLGKSSITPASGEAGSRLSLLSALTLSIAAPLFVVALLVGLSFTLDKVALGEPLVPELFMSWACKKDPSTCPKQPTLHPAVASSGRVEVTRPVALLRLSTGLAISILLAAVASRKININRFSLHALYRNRLIRAFLGASRRRRPDLLTGFDVDDNPKVCELWSTPEPKNWRPFHIINIALNVVSSKRLAWQERKAEPFVVTPLHCGSSYLGFRSSNVYGDKDGISLGTAMAISGAAASPNMGYNSSPGITFLMTMFNVRLGWWLGNPGKNGDTTFTHDGPNWAIVPLIEEAFGLTTDERRYVYLSDGGHFENLGLYQAVRRRCRFIVVVDAGCDPEFTFEDLGNAVRKIQIDLGITIHLYSLERVLKRTKDGSVLSDANYHAVGEIDYASSDGGGSKNGVLLYLKAGYHGTESAGVRSYASRRLEFPHESTLNQWFSESQFEAYRLLGFEIADGVFSRALADSDCGSDADLETIFGTLMRLARGPVALPAKPEARLEPA